MKTTAKWLYPASLIVLFIILITAVIPDGAVYGSNTDWLSQHVTLAEAIRTACLEQHTLLPDWIGLGGGSNGYQFAYYGFLRPDLLIGCLLPQIPMVQILIGYMLSVYLCSVLLCYAWLRSEAFSPAAAWFGSILFMTAGCLFHMHRQIMFVNYLPFLLLAFLCVKSRRWKWLPLCMLMICLSSFYFAPAAFAAIAWYWYRREALSSGPSCSSPAGFLRGMFLKRFLPSALLAAGMAAALLLPVGMVLLEHGRNSGGFSLRTVLELFAPNPVFNNILFNEYGMGLTLICLYAILAGLRIRKMRPDSILFLRRGSPASARASERNVPRTEDGRIRLLRRAAGRPYGGEPVARHPVPHILQDHPQDLPSGYGRRQRRLPHDEPGRGRCHPEASGIQPLHERDLLFCRI